MTVSDLYFAFGSNMLTARLTERCPSAAPAGTALLHGHVLRFHKRSKKDGTGKANALWTGQPLDVVRGVLFEMTATDLSALDKNEGRGKGYERVPIVVVRQDGAEVTTWIYIATPDAIDDRLKPTAAYLRLVVDGAKEHGLPAEYVKQIEGNAR